MRAPQGTIRADGGGAADSFAVEIARALDIEFGGSTGKIKVVARLTRSNEKTVKNWFGGRNGPNGDGLVLLMRHSDEVLRTVLRLAERDDMLIAVEVLQARARLRTMVSTLDRLLDEDRSDVGT